MSVISGELSPSGTGQAGTIKPETIVAVVQPSAGYSAPHRGAVRAFLQPTKRGVKRIELERGSSMLPRVFNMLWCEALNARKQYPISHFAMIHDDIAADMSLDLGWLDILLDELERTGADVISAVVPIKDEKGVTSTAIETDDPWWVRRLAMHEVFQLPETFSASDVPWNKDGRPLLLNTGLWLCKFDPAWVEKIEFHFYNRIVRMPDGEFMSQDQPEDWDVSRQFHALGLKCVATRKVPLVHGLPHWHNKSAWGTWPTDLAYLQSRRVLNAPTGPYAFPEEVPGWLSPAEGAALSRLAAGKAVLEIGSYCGRSTICLAQTAESVYAVDTFDGRATTSPRDTLAELCGNLITYGVMEKVTICRGSSDMTVPNIETAFDLAFIDGDHTREAVLRDAEMARAKLKEGGVLVFHDYGRPGDEGVTAAVDTLLKGGAELIDCCETVAVVRLAA